MLASASGRDSASLLEEFDPWYRQRTVGSSSILSQPTAAALQARNSRVGVRQRQDRQAVHHDSQRVRAGARAGQEHYGEVTVHTLRHTALSRMIEHGPDDYTVMSISGHSSTRMLERFTHPTLERRIAALDTFNLHEMSTKRCTAKRGSRSCLIC